MLTHTQEPSFEADTTAPVEGYTLLYMPASGGSTTTVSIAAFGTDAITATVKELEKGTEYIFSIIARNSAGDGATLTLVLVQTDIDRELVVGRRAGERGWGRGSGGEGGGESGWGRGGWGEWLGERGVGRVAGGERGRKEGGGCMYMYYNFMYYQKHISFPKGGGPGVTYEY